MSPIMAWIDAIPDSITFAITILLVLALCALSNRRNHASPGPDAEKASGARPGASPTEGAVVSRPALIRLERSPERDQATDLSTHSVNYLQTIRSVESTLDSARTGGASGPFSQGDTAHGPSVVVRSTAEAGASAFIYRWVRPAEGKKLAEFGWNLEHVDPRYESWLIRKVERWP